VTQASAKDVAMHVAAGAAPGAIRPVAVSRNEVPADMIEKERAIYAAQAAESGKPADIVAKMVEGRVNKYLAEITLLGQPFVKNPDDTVEKHLKAKGATVNASRCTSSAKASRRRRTTLRAKWRQ
jgi:elongation factor Ts